MNRHYISDVYEPHERAALRAEGRHIGLVLAIATAMVVLLALLVWPRPTHAQEAFKLPVPSCYFEHIDYRYELGDPYDAIIWWCDAESGLEENYRTGELGGIREFLFRVNAAGKDLWQADRQIFVRALTPRESTLVQRLSTAGEPRCVFATTAKTTQVLSKSLDGTIGPVRTDATGKAIRWPTTSDRPSCYAWVKEGTKRWCSVTGLLDTMGREIGPDSYVACKLVTAPAQGWQ
jgi:hypothetical protein